MRVPACRHVITSPRHIVMSSTLPLAMALALALMSMACFGMALMPFACKRVASSYKQGGTVLLNSMLYSVV